MRRYKITHVEEMFRFAGFSIFHIEFLRFSIVDISTLSRKGKKKQATQAELDLFAFYKNVVWLIEWTTEKGFNTTDFDNFKTKIEILNSNRKLLEELINKIKQKFTGKININAKEVKVIGLYINPYFTAIQAETLEHRLSSIHTGLIYVWDCDTFEYFKVVSSTIRGYSKYEFFTYFNILPEFVFDKGELEGRRGITPYGAIEIEKGIFGFPTYTFKITPKNLLERCYVLRNEGWRSDSFQRMVIPRKLANIREYILKSGNTSFANNIIISPSPEIDTEDIIKKSREEGVKIYLPFKFSSFCIIDGQHRLFAFTQDFYGEQKGEREEKQKDERLRNLAEDSEIIVTLVQFSGDEDEILKKQTTLFKDINSNQTKVKTDFIYNLREITEPSHPESIANKVVRYLNDLEDGVFKDKFAIKTLPSYRGRIKRSSVVRWGLTELVDKENRFFISIYPEQKLEDISDYVKFCGDNLNKYFSCMKYIFKKKYRKNIWDNWRKTGFMLLSTSSLVGFLRLYRHFIISTTTKDENKIKEYLSDIKVDFKKDKYVYVSSQWAKLEEAMFSDIRKKHGNFGDENLIKR